MKAVLLATVCIGVTASSAFAWDWRVKSQLGQSLEINDNRDLRTNPLGVSYAPVTSLLLDILARTPTTRFEASGNLDYRTYFGPGAVDTTDGLDKDARARFTKTTKLTTYDIGASYSQRDASNVQLQDTGFSTVSGDIITYALDGGLTHRFGSRDTFAFISRGSSVRFTSPTETPYDDFTGTATWTHRASRTIDLIGLVNYYFQDRATSDITLWKATGGIDARLSPRLTLKGSAGAAFVESVSEGGAQPADPSNSILPASGSAVGWIADALLTYRLRATTLISFSAARSIAPDALGDIQLRDIFTVTLVEEINRRSSLTFAGSFSRNSGGGAGGTSDNLNASATYSYRLTPEVYTNIAYRFAQISNTSGTAHSNSMFLSIRRDVTILP